MTGAAHTYPHIANKQNKHFYSFLPGHTYPIINDSKKGVTRVLHKKAFFKKFLSLALFFIQMLYLLFYDDKRAAVSHTAALLCIKKSTGSAGGSKKL